MLNDRFPVVQQRPTNRVQDGKDDDDEDDRAAVDEAGRTDTKEVYVTAATNGR